MKTSFSHSTLSTWLCAIAAFFCSQGGQFAKGQAVNYSPLYNKGNFVKNIDLSLPVGIIKGNPDVNNNGAATYVIPIDVPPGTAGLIPTLSVSYNSHAGNGLVGYGWNINGISAVSADKKSLYYDNQNNPADYFSGNLSYLIDGNRLLPIQSSGVGNPRYMAEVSDFNFVERTGVANNAATGFTAYSKDGKRYYYGLSTAEWETLDTAYHYVSGVKTYNYYPIPHIWYLSRVLDASGNYMDYKYSQINGERLLKEIDYTGNLNSGQQTYNKIVFNYVSRSDTNYLRQPYVTTKKKNLLGEIDVYSEANLVRTYTFNYGQSSEQYSFLKEVVQGGADDTHLNSTIFRYGDLLDSLVVTTPVHVDPGFTVCDVNGDGISDVIAPVNIPGGSLCSQFNTGFDIYTGNVSGNNFPSGGHITTSQSEYISSNLSTLYLGVTKPVSPNYQKVVSTDFDGDGKDDVIRLRSTVQILSNCPASETRANQLNVFFTNGNGQFTEQDFNFPNANLVYEIKRPFYAQIADYDGDHLPEALFILKDVANGYKNQIFVYNKNLNSLVLANASTFTCDQFDGATDLFTGDFDGDGDAEIFVRIQDTISIYNVSLTGNSCSIDRIYKQHYFIGNDDHFWPGDFNGDGITDLMQKSGIYYFIWSGTGTDFTIESFPYSTTQLDYQDKRDQGNFTTGDWMLTGDYNGDGKADMLHEYRGVYNGSYRSEVEVYYSLGSGRWDRKTYELNFTFPDVSGGTVTVSDMDGDNRSDVFTGLRLISFRPSLTDKLLESVKNGFGNTTTYSYNTLSRSNQFSNDHTSYGTDLVTKTVPLTVVTHLEENSGLQGIPSVGTDYSYANPILHLLGKGLLGFQSFKVANKALNKINETNIYFQTFTTSNPRLRILPGETDITVNAISPAQILSKKKDFLTLKPGNWTDVFQADHRNVETTDYLSGAITSESMLYDNYGNVSSSVKDVANGLETATATYSYVALASNPFPYPSFPINIIETKQRQGNAAVSKTTTYGYYGTGLPSIRTEFAGLANSITTTYTRDAYGNVSDETVSAASVSPRQYHYSYDNFNRFVVEKVNPLSQHEYFIYDGKWGALTQFKGIDQIIINNDYDGYGRLIATILPQRTITESLTWNVDPSCNGIYQKNYTNPGYPAKVEQYDPLNRPVVTKTYTWASDPSIVQRTYDGIDKLLTVTQPHFANETNYYTTTNSYDWLNRIQTTCDQLHGCTNYLYSYSNGQLTTTQVNSSGQLTGIEVDATGKTVMAVDEGGKVFLYYDSWGNQVEGRVGLQSAQASVFKKYDDYDRLSELTDADAGTVKYQYDSYGQEISETDANGNTHTMQYDDLGKLTQKSGPEGTATYQYYSGSNPGEGNQVQHITGYNSSEDFYYDNQGRLTSHYYNLNSQSYVTSYGYDNLDRLTSKTYQGVYGSTVDIENTYNYFGTLVSVDYNGTNLFNCNAIDGKNAVTSYTRNNGTLQSTVGYNYGYLTGKFTSGYQDYGLSYNYQTGNITDREDHLKQLTETFQYDLLNRLTSSSITNSGPLGYSTVPQTITYQTGSSYSNGNIATKWNLGTYNYAKKPHAVTFISNDSGVISQANQDIVYTAFQKVQSITEGQFRQDFQYGDDYQCNTSNLYLNSSQVNQHDYIGEGYEVYKDFVANTEKHIIYVPGGDGICAIIVRGNDGENIYYPFTDHLNTITALTDASNNVVFEQAFDAWGVYRDPGSWTHWGRDYVTGTGFEWLKGFTGHENMREFNLINMNARLYDPVNGRMLSPDNILASENSTQDYNRYSYCGNNPVSRIDPDGNFWHIVVGALIGGIANTAMHWQQITAGGEFNLAAAATAFTIGAAAGGVAAATFGGSLAASGAALTTTNVAMVTTAAMVGTASSQPILYTGNAIAFGDPYPTPAQQVVGIAAGGAMAGLGTGIANSLSGYNFWLGNVTPASVPTLPQGAMTEVLKNQAGEEVHLPIAGKDVLPETVITAHPITPVNYAEGSFSIVDWTGYPGGIPKPRGPFRLIEGDEYETARNAANAANRALSREMDFKNKFIDIHEITPVKFGGSPTNITNKIFIDRAFHQQQVTPFWNYIMKSIKSVP